MSETTTTEAEIQRLHALLAEACICDSTGCRKFIADTASRLVAALGETSRHPTTFHFDDDDEQYDPTGEWIDDDERVWSLEGWLYPAGGQRPIPLMRMTEAGDVLHDGPIEYLTDLINEYGAKRTAGV